jgi:hypothetical protein
MEAHGFALVEDFGAVLLEKDPSTEHHYNLKLDS